MDSTRDTRRSRVVTGFHRVGLVLAVPVFLAAMGVAVTAWFSEDGAYIPDPTSTPPEVVLLQGRIDPIAGIGKDTEGTYRISVGDRPVRTFVIRPDRPPSKPLEKDALIGLVLESIFAFERARGAVLLANEQPIKVGDIALVQEDETARTSSGSRWTHLRRGLDWGRTYWAAGVAAFALLLYLIARAVGWVLDGFMR